MRKWVLIGIIAVLALVLGLGVRWYIITPHTPEAQFAAAEKMERELRGEAVSKSAKDLAPKIEATIEQYRRVWTRFGKNAKAPEALQRIAKIHEEVEKDLNKALADLEQLAKDYPGEEYEGYALIAQADLINKQANALKAEKKPEADARYRAALAKLEEYRRKFEKGKDAAKALMAMGCIWQDGIEEPPIHALEIFQQVLKDYPRSEFEAEALYRLAMQYERIKEYERALQLYAQLLEEYPKCDQAAKALAARGRLLAEKMDQHEEAAKAFEKLAQDFPDAPQAQGAAGAAREQKAAAAEDEGKKYGQSRYGGRVPVDSTDDKPLPPAEQLKQFTAQKLDAQLYDLNVALEPAEHRVTVTGTLTLINKGDDKKTLLFLLGADLNVTGMTMDGAAAQTTHKGQTLQVVLPALLKKDAQTTLGFSYTGQYADVSMMKNLQPGPNGGTRGAKPGTTTTPATASAPASATASAPATTTAPATTQASLAFDPQIGLGEYGYGLSGAAWYPITIIGDVFDAHVTFTTPANLEAVCNGALTSRAKSTVAGAPGRFEFQTKNPVFGLYFAYGPYVVQDSQVGDIHFYTYFRPENKAKHDAYVQVANRILSFYAGKFAPFPYEKMAIIETPLPPFLGGVGPASLMFLQESMVAHPEVPETLLAHELAHQWFGNLIPINITDPGYNQWLSEGFATYCDALYTEFKDGPKAFGMHIEKYQQLYFQCNCLASYPLGWGKGGLRICGERSWRLM